MESTFEQISHLVMEPIYSTTIKELKFNSLTIFIHIQYHVGLQVAFLWKAIPDLLWHSHRFDSLFATWEAKRFDVFVGVDCSWPGLLEWLWFGPIDGEINRGTWSPCRKRSMQMHLLLHDMLLNKHIAMHASGQNMVWSHSTMYCHKLMW